METQGIETVRVRDLRAGDQIVERGGAVLTVTEVTLNGNYHVLSFARYGSTRINPRRVDSCAKIDRVVTS